MRVHRQASMHATMRSSLVLCCTHHTVHVQTVLVAVLAAKHRGWLLPQAGVTYVQRNCMRSSAWHTQRSVCSCVRCVAAGLTGGRAYSPLGYTGVRALVQIKHLCTQEAACTHARARG